MSVTSTPNHLTLRVHRRMEADRQRIEEMAKRELEQLGEKCERRR